MRKVSTNHGMVIQIVNVYLDRERCKLLKTLNNRYTQAIQDSN